MFVRHRTAGFIFKKQNVGEGDQFFSVYTKDWGRIEVVGKAIRKLSAKLRSGIDIFYYSEIEFIQGKSLKILTDSFVLLKFKQLRKDLLKLKEAYRFAELIDTLIKGEEKDKKIWNLILGTFKELNKKEIAKEIFILLYFYFFWKIIVFSGYKPELDCCVNCGRKSLKGAIYFTMEKGGLLCYNCINIFKKARRIDLKILKVLKILIEQNWNFVKKLKIDKSTCQALKLISGEAFLHFKSL